MVRRMPVARRINTRPGRITTMGVPSVRSAYPIFIINVTS
jgi:hypothetical protein